MMNLYELDERQKKNFYKAGFESFFLLTILFLFGSLLREIGMQLLQGESFTWVLIWGTQAYFWIRQELLDCGVTDRKRRRDRIFFSIMAAVGAVWWGGGWINHGFQLADEFGHLSMDFVSAEFLLAIWIIATIKWVRKFQGYED
ncbi:MAG: hypothetical protein Q4C25_07775 [Bacillota bacterium]|nr:hypothetical protein [Bacillota bacterium]